MRACSKGHIDIARMLVGEYNANIDIVDTVSEIGFFITPLHLVVIDVLLFHFIKTTILSIHKHIMAFIRSLIFPLWLLMWNLFSSISQSVLLLLFYAADTLVSMCCCISTSFIGSSNFVTNLLGVER